ncbi:DUF6686 family protein [Salmonirosea aquatica]|uniref:Uncharacterized protein n=1 Tax=Salmonirosea aquatica TaxID=2654236 RepID=A0A7C9BGM4_9BACT|nr:hypothetical protein [Cytophagaceae bacterium SJW1-29]
MDHTDHRPVTLALTPNGQVALCRGCLQGITVEFGPILQLFARKDFLRLEYNMRYMCPAEYFRGHPGRSKIIVNTTAPDLYFAFTETEFLELQELLGHGLSKLQLIESADRHLN